MKTQIVDAGLREVANIKQLKGIALEHTKIAKEGVVRLQKALLSYSCLFL